MKIDKRKLLIAMSRMRINDYELCDKAGIAKITLSQMKSGKRNPKPATIGKLAYALGIEPEDIIEEKE